MKTVHANELKRGDIISLPKDGGFVSGKQTTAIVSDTQYCGFGIQRVVVSDGEDIFAFMCSCHWPIEVSTLEGAKTCVRKPRQDKLSPRGAYKATL